MEIMLIERIIEILFGLGLGFFSEGLSLWEDKENWYSSHQKMCRFTIPPKGSEWTTTV